MQPTKFDVVCGKGRSKEAGTPKYKLLVNENKVLYVKCPESDKKKITLSIINAVHALGGRFLLVDKMTGDYKLEPKPYDKVSQALRGGQPKLRMRLYKHGQMPRERKQYSQESYDQYSRFLLSYIHDEGESKPSNLSRDVAELFVLGAVIEPTRRHSKPEEWSSRRIKMIKMLPRSNSDRTMKTSNVDDSFSPAPGLGGCPVRSRSEGSISAAKAGGISQQPLDYLDIVSHDIDSVGSSLYGEDLSVLWSDSSNQSEQVKSCSMTDVATMFKRMSTDELNPSCKNESSICHRSFGNSKDWMLSLNSEDVRTCEEIFKMFDSSEDEKSACNSVISGLSKESHVDGELTGTRCFMNSFSHLGLGKSNRVNSRDSFVDSSCSMTSSL
mmetsp:Transcript_6443/g.14569  ORF Transcript_6443/g.14569 Transcript_6443/m.14569 type:complete len:384 (+) Transcript_6443:2-1153(+)